MLFRARWAVILVLGGALSANAQLSQDARYSVLASMIATEGAARIPMPLGKTGVELTSAGLLNTEKLQKEISDNGQAIVPGNIVSITAVDFHDKSIEFELEGGGTVKKGFLSNVQLSVGGVSNQQPTREEKAKGSKITLLFDDKIRPDLTVEELKDLLNPVLDFTKQSVAGVGIEALPPEFQEAVKAREARIGMDSNTVLLAMGQPNRRITERNDKGVEQEDWVYIGRGRRQTFVTFEKDVVVSIREY